MIRKIERHDFIKPSLFIALVIICSLGFGTLLMVGTGEAAETSGSVNHYIATPLVFQNPVVAVFNKEYPNVKVNLERNDTYVLYQKILTEASAGKVSADVCGLTDFLIIQDLKKKGILAEFLPPNDGDFLADFKVKGWIYPYYLSFVAPMYNTKLVSEKDLPKSWLDLLDPKWKGKLCSTTPELGGTSWILYYFLRKNFGLDYWKKLAQQDVTIHSTSATAATQSIISGENLILIDTPLHVAYVPKKKKEPVDLALPKEGVPFTMEAEGLVKGGPNPGTAKTYLTWLLSKEGQTTMCLANGLYSAVDGIPNAEGMPPKSQIKIWYPDWEEWGRLRTEWVNEWKVIFKR
jgi:iron(III) transport system substrate-binding protein